MVFITNGSVTRLLDGEIKGGMVGSILAYCDIFRIHCTVRTGTNILSLHVFNYVVPFFYKSCIIIGIWTFQFIPIA